MQKHFSPGVFGTYISLQRLLDHLVDNSLSVAIHKKSRILNEVGKGIILANQRVIAVINELINVVLSNSRNGEIHITADRFRDIVTICIEERNNYNGYALAYSISTIEPDARGLGGHISIKNPQQKVATISFSFPNHQANSIQTKKASRF